MNGWLIAASLFPVPQGACKSFDAAANGYARSDGIAIVVLRKAGLGAEIGTWAARAPYARVLACATNNDGHTKEGITFPSGPAQRALAQEVAPHPLRACLPVCCPELSCRSHTCCDNGQASCARARKGCLLCGVGMFLLFGTQWSRLALHRGADWSRPWRVQGTGLG